MMADRLRRRNLRGFGTLEKHHCLTEEWLFRSNNCYHRCASTFEQYKTEPYWLRQYSKQLEANTADRIRYIKIGLKKRKFRHRLRLSMRPDRIFKYPQEMFDYEVDGICYSNERLAYELHEDDDQTDDHRDQLQQRTENTLHEMAADIDSIIRSKNTEIEYLKREIDRRDLEKDNLRSILNLKQAEIDKQNEYYITTGLRGKDIQLKNEQKADAAKCQNLCDKKNEFKKQIVSLNAEVESRGRKVRELETKLNNKEIEVSVSKNHLQSTVAIMNQQLSEQRNQLQQTLTKLQETKTKMENTVLSLNQKNQDLQSEVERRNLEVKTLQEMLHTKKITIDDRDERQVKNVMRQKDQQISDLRHQLKLAQKKLDENNTEMNGIEASLKQKVGGLEKELERRNMKIKDLEVSPDSREKATSDRKEILDNEVKENIYHLHKHKEQQQQMIKKLHEKEAEMEAIIASLKKKIKHQEEEMETKNMKIKHLEEVLNSKTKEIPARDEPNRGVRQMENKIKELADQLDETLAKLHETKNELDETKTRLSKAMGNKLTDNNPNIADLSDKNRPTKLSERFAELYDNQWTDAFDILDKHFHTEETTITALLQILKDVMSFCKNVGHKQMEDLRRVLAFASKHDDGSVPRDMNKLLKDCRKAMATMAICNLYEMYMSHIRQSKDETIKAALTVSSFTKECLEVCWFMVVQDPAVEFAPVLSKGSRFNTDLFKPYTKSGTHVDYVVWPALLLHEAGPVLTKGVAQGYGKKSN